jgi:hypothetical protein
MLRKLEEHEPAVAAFQRALELAPDDADTHFFLAHAQLDLHREDQALKSFERALELNPDFEEAARSIAAARPRSETFDRLGYVIIGTTGLCNASCLHCPTGKAETAHVPRTPMAMPLFRQIIDQVAELGVPIYGQLAFGLFGDGLVDPFVVERMRYAREKFPNLPIAVNTNGAAFNMARHSVLRDFSPVIGLHVESLDPETFNHLMQPLRLERVLPKYEQILETFKGHVHVSIPASRRNLGELTTIRAWFEQREAHVVIVPLSSRCAEDRTLFESLALAPTRMRCTSRVLEDLIIDSDGDVLGCCQDFRRVESIGKVGPQSVREVLVGKRRADLARLLDGGRHIESSACQNCFTDTFGDYKKHLPEQMAIA